MKLKLTWTIPNILTTVRLCAIPVMAVFIYLSGRPDQLGRTYSITAFCFFVAIWLTDAADGFIARRYNQVSDFGKIYDPFVDKLFQFTAAFMLFLIGRLPLWVVVFIIVKEVLMLLGGAYLLQKKSVVVYSKWYGKVSTVLFVISLSAVFFVPYECRYWIDFIFVPPVLMSTYATVRYGITLVKDAESFRKKGVEEVPQKPGDNQ